MAIDRLRKAVHAEPFKPFAISLTDGRRFRVPHPDFMPLVRKPTRTIVVAGKGEDYSIIEWLLVSSLDFVNGKTMAASTRPTRNTTLTFLA